MNRVSDVDPLPTTSIKRPLAVTPGVNYLARDFASLRRAVFDRLTATSPQYRERRLPDIGVTLIDLFAYLGDYLHYRQDAVAAEAYLAIAKKRRSLRRHALLVGAQIFEGRNARVFVAFTPAYSLARMPVRDVILSAGPRPTSEQPKLPSQEQLNSEIRANQRVFFELASEPCDPERQSVLWKRGMIPDLLGFAAGIVARVNGVAEELWREMSTGFKRQLIKAVCEEGYWTRSFSREFWNLIVEIVRRRPLSPSEVNPAVLSAVNGGGRSSLETEAVNIQRLRSAFPQQLGPNLEPGFVHFDVGLNLIEFHRTSSLQKQATSAILKDAFLDEAPLSDSLKPSVAARLRKRKLASLHAGGFLLISERVGRRSGLPADADPARRQVVRITRVRHDFDDRRRPIVHVEWHEDDRLRTDFVLESQKPPPDCATIEKVAVANGNVFLADHGLTMNWQPVGVVPPEPIFSAPCNQACPSDAAADKAKRRSLVEIDLPVYWPNLTFVDAVPSAASAFEAIARRRPGGASAGTTTEIDAKVPVARPAIQTMFIPAQSGWTPPKADDPQFAQILTAGSVTTPDQLLPPEDDSAWTPSRSVAWSTNRFRGLIPWSLWKRMMRSVEGCGSTFSVPAPQNSTGPCDESQSAEDLQAFRHAMVWRPIDHLLSSHGRTRAFVVEREENNATSLRFGEGEYGARPPTGTVVWAHPRVGGGSVGNIGTDTLLSAWSRTTGRLLADLAVTNPFAATGGADAESISEIRSRAPLAHRTPARAIVPDDYRDLLVERFRGRVQSAAAFFLWTGSRLRVAVAIDPDSKVVDVADLVREAAKYLATVRRLGHDIHVSAAREVALWIEMEVTASPGFSTSQLRKELTAVLGSEERDDGRRGFFHADHFQFGDPVVKSRLLAAARRVAGSADAKVLRLQRYTAAEFSKNLDPTVEPPDELAFKAFELPILRNDPRDPSKGVMKITVREAS